jgi:uncharacterized protein (TIGR04255 family)
MNNRTLPEYQKPPLQEVALSVQLEPLSGFDLTHYGKLHSVYSDGFPLIETHPSLDPVIERFGTKKRPSPPTFQMMTGAEFPRIWFLNEQRTELVQIQRDRFTKNWRKVEGSESYPRYEDYIRPNFERDYKKFLRFTEDNALSDVKPIQCDVTYVNHILPNSKFSQNDDTLASVISFFGVSSADAFLNPLEGFSFSASQIIKTNDTPIARLVVNINTGLTNDGDSMLRLNLTVRGPVAGADLESVLNFMDMGRETIVNSFDRITSSEMHDHWNNRGKS